MIQRSRDVGKIPYSVSKRPTFTNLDSRRLTIINLFQTNLKAIDDTNMVRSGGTVEKL